MSGSEQVKDSLIVGEILLRYFLKKEILTLNV